jgi:hypothetical protein
MTAKTATQTIIHPFARTYNLLRRLALIAATLVVLASPLRAAPISMAVMGDSLNLLTDTYDTSWVVQLQNAGAITPHDVAFDGAISGDVVNSQLPSVVTLAQQGQITDSVLIVGGNDFGPYGPYAADLFLNGADPTPIINTVVHNIETTITSIANANPGVHQVIANVPNIVDTPVIQYLIQAYGISPAVVQGGINDIQQVNAQIEQFALARQIPVIDLYSAIGTLAPLYPFTFGGHSFDTMFASNGFDVLTQPEGLLSNMVATAFNLGYGQNLPMFSDQQIVTTSGFTPDGNTTFFNVRPFVIVPEPSSLLLAGAGALGLIVARRRFSKAPRIGRVA